LPGNLGDKLREKVLEAGYLPDELGVELASELRIRPRRPRGAVPTNFRKV